MMDEAFQYICVANPLNVNIVNQRPNGGYVHSVIQEVKEYQELRELIFQFAINGEWTRDEYRWVDIRHIEPRDVWKPQSLQHSLGLIQQGQELMRVLLSVDGVVDGVERYTISDGIHRIHALTESGFTHVLALVQGIRVQGRSPIPPGLENLFPYATLEEMALLNRAAIRLCGKLNVDNVYILREPPYNVIEFSILRNDVTIGNVKTLPPDCMVTVTGFNFENGGFNITTTAILFGNQYHFSGSYEAVSAIILRMLGVMN